MKMMLISVLKSREVRVAIVNSNGAQNAPVLHDLHMEKFANRSSQGNIYKAKVVSINDQLQAAFVDFGDLKHGLLTLDKIHYKYGRRGTNEESSEPQRIADALKVNDDVLVQVERDARVDKGAALTGQIQLHGQHVVLNTNRPITRISRQINREQRAEIEAMLPKFKVPKDCGLVIRTSARGRSQKELQTDVRECTDLLKLIEQAYLDSQAPRLLYEANNLVNSVMRDNLHNNIERVIVDDQSIYDDLCTFVKSYMADFSGEIQLYRDEIPLYTKYRIESQVSKVFDRTIDLPSGGQIVLDPTEALLTIDVNSAQFRFNDNFRDMVLNTNLEAADEIFNQLRLRDIGGLIVIDFIDLYEVQDIRKLEDKVARLCDLDRGRTKWEPISSFGLMELQRRRPRSSIYDTDFHRCEGCGGHGYRQTVDSVGHRIFREIEARSHSKRIARIRARVTPAVAQYLTNDLRAHLSMVEMRSSAKLEIVPDQDGEDASFVVESFSTTYSKTPIKTKNFEYGIPENGKSKKGKINRETQAESIQTAAVKRPEITRKPQKKSEVKTVKDTTAVTNVLGSTTRFFRFVPAVPTYLYKRLFLVDTPPKRTKESKQHQVTSRKSRSKQARDEGNERVNKRVKQKITRRAPNRSTARSSETKRFEERTLSPSVPTTKNRKRTNNRAKDGHVGETREQDTNVKAPASESKKKHTRRTNEKQEKEANPSTRTVPKTKDASKAKVKNKDKKAKAKDTPDTALVEATDTESPQPSNIAISDPNSTPQTSTHQDETSRETENNLENIKGSPESTSDACDQETSEKDTEPKLSGLDNSQTKQKSKSGNRSAKNEIQVTIGLDSDSSATTNPSDCPNVDLEPKSEIPVSENETTEESIRATNDPRIKPKATRPRPIVTP